MSAFELHTSFTNIDAADVQFDGVVVGYEGLPYSFTYTSALSANTVALHRFATYLLLPMTSRLSPPSASVIREMTTVSASILSASMWIGNSGFGCGYSQQIVPRQLVAQESPDAVQ